MFARAAAALAATLFAAAALAQESDIGFEACAELTDHFWNGYACEKIKPAEESNSCRVPPGYKPSCVEGNGRAEGDGWWYVRTRGAQSMWVEGTDAACCAAEPHGDLQRGDPAVWGEAPCLSANTKGMCELNLFFAGWRDDPSLGDDAAPAAPDDPAEDAPDPQAFLVASHTDMCVSVADGPWEDYAKIVQLPCDGRAGQRWSFTRAGDGVFMLRADASGKCIDVAGGSLEDGGEVILYGCHGGENQQWRMVQVDDRSHLVNVHSGKCLDVAGVSYDAGGPLHQWTCLGPEQGNQLFHITGGDGA